MAEPGRTDTPYVTRLSFDTGDPISPVNVERVGRLHAGVFHPWADVWAVRWRSWCLDVDGEWVHEPLPSSRDADFLTRTRCDRLEAMRRAAKAARVLREEAARV